MEKIFIVLLRISLGWFMFFAGIEKVFNPEWTAAGFLQHAQTFPEFYAWLAQPQNLIWIDPLNAWGITLIGVALVFGFGIRFAGIAGALLMILYYFPHIAFPTVPHGFIVEEHIIYGIVFLLIAFSENARNFSVVNLLKKTPLWRVPILKKILS